MHAPHRAIHSVGRKAFAPILQRWQSAPSRRRAFMCSHGRADRRTNRRRGLPPRNLQGLVPLEAPRRRRVHQHELLGIQPGGLARRAGRGLAAGAAGGRLPSPAELSWDKTGARSKLRDILRSCVHKERQQGVGYAFRQHETPSRPGSFTATARTGLGADLGSLGLAGPAWDAPATPRQTSHRATRGSAPVPCHSLWEAPAAFLSS